MQQRLRLGVNKQQKQGFTIVELLVVIVVISILATIAIISYAGIQQRANNASRTAEFRLWVEAFDMYKAQFGVYPLVARGTASDPISYCLGTGFPVGSDGQQRCRDYIWACDHSINSACTSFRVADSTSLMTEMAKVVTISGGNKIPVAGTVGPYAEFYQWNFMIQQWYDGTSVSDCPSFATGGWYDAANKRLACYVSHNYDS